MSEPVSQPPYPDGPPGAPGTSGAGYPPYSPYPPYPGYPGYPGYPAYPGYPLYSQPPGYPPFGPPPKKDSTRTVYIIIGVVVAVLVVLCAAGGVLLSAFDNVAQHSFSNILSSATVEEFCTNEETQDYSSAYFLLSANLQQQYSQSQFAQDGQQHDTALGTITSCTPQGEAAVTGQTATMTILVTRTLTPTPDASGAGNAPPQTSESSGQISLIEVSGQWRVDSVDPGLNML